MKKYKLLKDLPCAEAGEIFQQGYDENDKDNVYLFQGALGVKYVKIWLDYIDDFDEWFEEVKDVEIPDEFYIPAVYSDERKIEAVKVNNIVSSSSVLRTIFLNNSEIGSAFKNKEEAERYIEYLKAKAIIKQDTKGFKPNWSNGYSYVYFGCWNNKRNELYADSTTSNEKYTTIYFKTKKDLLNSFKKHPEEWKVYLTYEQ